MHGHMNVKKKGGSSQSSQMWSRAASCNVADLGLETHELKHGSPKPCTQYHEIRVLVRYSNLYLSSSWSYQHDHCRVTITPSYHPYSLRIDNNSLLLTCQNYRFYKKPSYSHAEAQWVCDKTQMFALDISLSVNGSRTE
jgi:hypothetical protein